MNGGLSMVEMKSGYKMTEVGVIPEDWEVKEFNETFSVIPNNSLSRDYLNTHAGEYHDIHYGDVLIRYGALLDAGNTEIPFINLLAELKNRLKISIFLWRKSCASR